MRLFMKRYLLIHQFQNAEKKKYNVYLSKNQLQVAADAAAVAGVAYLDGSNDPVQEQARQAAWKFACKNRAVGSQGGRYDRGRLLSETS
jgi:hypothetical protein